MVRRCRQLIGQLLSAARRMADSDDEIVFVGETSTAAKRSAGSSASTSSMSGSYRGRVKDTTRVVSWNIDGLSEGSVLARASAVVDELKRLNPDVILLQEVVSENRPRLCAALEACGYSWHDGGAGAMFPYHCAIALKNEHAIKKAGELVAFSDTKQTRMGRHLLKLECEVLGVEAMIMTSHLESTGDPVASAHRRAQFERVLLEMASSDAPLTVFGADTNLRDKEAAEVRASTLGEGQGEVLDVWEQLGSHWATRWTWDTSVNHNLAIDRPMKCRFDRLFFKPAGGLVPTSFALAGKTLLPGSPLYPSDHWAMVCDFALPPVAGQQAGVGADGSPRGSSSSSSASAASSSSSSSSMPPAKRART